MKKIFLTSALFFTTLFAMGQNQFSTFTTIDGQELSLVDLEVENTPLTNYSFNSVQQNGSPYEWNWLVDGIWTGTALAGSTLGLYFIQTKDDITEAELAKIMLEEEDIISIDRWAAGNHSETANKLSDIPFAFSFVTPFIMLFDDEVNNHTGQVLGLYLESLATTAALYSLTAGLVDKSRPYVYDDSGDTSLDRRLKNNGQRSFYGGHIAASASATFFAAKIYSDFNPDSEGKIFVWTSAALIPASVAYLRVEAGQHFLTDVVIGYVLGATVGYFTPELHKRKNDNIDIYPSGGRTIMGDEYNGMAVKYTF